MSLYNLLHGVNPDTETLLNVLGYTTGDFGRFRNVYVQDGFIIVHTRCGGGNREDYSEVFSMAEDHPWYSHDQDDDFDSTYADIFFKLPDDQVRSFVGLCNQGEDPKDAWTKIFATFGVRT